MPAVLEHESDRDDEIEDAEVWADEDGEEEMEYEDDDLFEDEDLGEDDETID